MFPPLNCLSWTVDVQTTNMEEEKLVPVGDSYRHELWYRGWTSLTPDLHLMSLLTPLSLENCAGAALRPVGLSLAAKALITTKYVLCRSLQVK